VTHALSYLPAWIIVALIWHARIFSATSAWLVLVTHVLLGLTLASHGLLIAVPFGGSPQLAAVVSTFGAIGAAILALVFSHASTGAAVIFSLILPGGFYVFAIRAICGWENHQITTNALRGDPDSGLVLLPILIAALVRLFPMPRKRRTLTCCRSTCSSIHASQLCSSVVSMTHGNRVRAHRGTRSRAVAPQPMDKNHSRRKRRSRCVTCTRRIPPAGGAPR
jgi:hypothetical protein